MKKLIMYKSTNFRIPERSLIRLLFGLTFALLFYACSDSKNASLEKLYKQNSEQLNKLQVTATAYNSLPEQTTADNPSLAAWGDNIKPGMKAIAVSRDLIPLGLTHNTKVKIEGLSGTYRVLDKMNARWSKRIDIYMGKNTDKAKEWGNKQVVIYWEKNK